MFSSFAAHAAASVFLSATPAPLADVFVDTAAINCTTGTGALTDPVCSIGAAIAIAAPGDAIRIAPGTYTENVVLQFDLDLIGTSGAGVTIIDGGASGSVVTIPNAVTVTLEGLTLTNGRADYGGGVQVEGNVTIRNSTITGNRAFGDMGGNSSEWGGGGIGSINSGGGLPSYPVPQITIENSTISENIASFPTGDVRVSGGAMYVRFGDIRISNSTINGNTSREGAGGITLTRGHLNITNSTISGNVSQRGSAAALYIRVLPGSLIENCTITYNHAPSGIAGGLRVGPQLSLRNTVIAGNTSTIVAPGYDWQNIYGNPTSLGHNFIGSFGDPYKPVPFDNGLAAGDQVGTTEAPLVPRLHPLADNGGATQTHLPRFDSPLIGAADSGNFLPFDQRGVARPVGDGPDIGAAEYDDLVATLCNGDGGVQTGCTDCPCSNNSPSGTFGGCLNSAGTSARLMVSGNPSISLTALIDTDLRFSLTGAPRNTFVLLTSSDALAPTNPANPCFGLGSGASALVFDGLRCAAQNVQRHGGRTSNASGEVGTEGNPWGGEGLPDRGLANSFSGVLAGQERFFQAIYRDDPLAGCGRGLNTSQAARVRFTL